MKQHFRKLLIAATAATITGIAPLATQAAEEPVVNVFNWSDYIDESILTDFEAETGIKVVYDVFDSNDILETKLLAGASGYDVVVPSGAFLARQIQAGVFQKLDKSKLSNLGNMWDDIAQRVSRFDPDNAYSINYMWGTTGIGYNVGKVKERLPDAPTNSWALVFDPANAAKLADCGIHMLDAPDEMIPAALNYLGMEPTAHDKKSIAKARELLEGVRPHVQKFHSSEYINALANGDICVAIGWSGDVLQARDRAAEAGNNVEINYVIPDEGALMWFDQMAIPNDAPHPDNAHKFINFIMRAEVAAAASNYVYYANGNKASQAQLNEDVIGDPAVYPSAKAISGMYIVPPYPPKGQRRITRAWTNLKSGN